MGWIFLLDLFYFILFYFFKNLIHDLLLYISSHIIPYHHIGSHSTSFYFILILSLVVIAVLCYHVHMDEKNTTDTPEKLYKLYTLKQLAEILQLSKSHLYAMCRRRAIPYIDVSKGRNREYRFDIEEVKRFLYKKTR